MAEISDAFKGCDDTIHDGLELAGDELNTMLVLNNVDDNIGEQYHEQILNAKYLLIINDVEEKESKDQIAKTDINAEEHRIYTFDDINEVYFLLPFRIDLRNISIYVQFEHDFPWILLKQLKTNFQLKLYGIN